MTQYLALLGRQSALGLAELESLYGNARVQPFGPQIAFVEADFVEFKQLGGSIKLATVIERLDSSNWGDIERFLVKHAITFPDDTLTGKLQLGISAIGFKEGAARINATGLSIKKAFKKAGQSVRLVPNQTAELSSAQVYHNHLFGDKGLEIIVATDGQQTIIARTQAVQDIDAYTERDRGRPKRDARVGMLPPKLAQIIINLAVGPDQQNFVILDPFCGTGVVLQEAILMGFEVMGSDLDNRMIDYTTKNLQWLLHSDTITPPAELTVADATNHIWGAPNAFTTIASETYLGRPFTATPDREILNKTVSECNLIIKKFLRNVAAQTRPGFRLCIAVPAWQTRPNDFKHLPLVDSLSELGYNRVRFEHVQDDQLLYYREDQIVARELLVLQRK